MGYVVESLKLRDHRLRVVITEDWFAVMPKVENAPLVFISYAREDYTHARQLADTLHRAGFRHWLDKDSLIPGQRWKVAVREAIRHSDFVVLLLSRASVNKRGYVQKEIREALEALDEHPETTVFLIPSRLEPCEPSHFILRDLQILDLFPDWNAGVARLMAALRSREPNLW